MASSNRQQGWFKKMTLQGLTLQKKLLLLVTLLLLTALVLLSLIAGQLLTREVDKAVASEMQGNLQRVETRASDWLMTKKAQLEALAQQLPGAPDSQEAWVPFLTLARQAQNFDLVHIGTASGQVIQSRPAMELPEGADPRTRPWFIQAQQENKLIVTPVYVDLITGGLTLTLAIPLKQQPAHVLGGDLHISGLVDELLQQKMRWSSQLLMLDAENRILAHHDPALLQKKLQEVLPGFKLEEDAIQQLEFKGKQWFATSRQVEGTRWRFLLLVDAAEVNAAYYDLLQRLGGLALLVLLVSGGVVVWLSRALTLPLKNFQQQLVCITQTLDLNLRLQVPQQTEWFQLANQTNCLLERIQRVVQNVTYSSSQLNASARNLAQTAGLVGQNASFQDQLSQTMAAAVEEMSSSVAEITSTMEELSASSTQIADHSSSVVDVAKLTLDKSRKGVDAMQDLQGQMQTIHQDNQQNLEEILSLGTQSKQISRVMDLINNLADQTKLIAFNAALEASSAGESGRRFSVVAGEIRRLADSVTESTHEIEGRIQAIQDTISRLVISSEKGATSIQSGLDVSAATAEDLSALLEAASQTSSAAEQISLSTQQQKTASSQVVVALRDIASASSHNSQSVRQITDISEEMLSMSKSLMDLVKEFNQDKNSTEVARHE